MKTSTLLPVVAYLGLAGFASAAPIQNSEAESHLDKRFFCVFGFGWGCNTPTTTSAAPVKTSAASSAAKSSSVVPTSTNKVTVISSSSTAKSSAVAVSSAAKASSVAPLPSSTSAKAGTTSSATKVASANWAQCTDFDWSAWNDKEWTWGGGYSKEYVKDWYIAEYGLAPPPGMNWRQVSSLVSKFGAKTAVSGPKTTSKYSKGCNNPWTSAASATKSKAVTVTTAKPVSTTSVKPVVTSAAAQSSAAPVKPSSAVASSASVSPSKAAASSVVGGPASSSNAPASSSPSSSSAAGPAASSASAAPPAIVVPPVTVGSGNAASSSSAAASPASPSPAAPSQAGSDGPSTGVPGNGTGVPGSGVGQGANNGTGVPGVGSGIPGTGEGVNNGTATIEPQPETTAIAPITVNGFTYGGCAQEVAGRLLEKVQTSSASQSIESCTALCASYGYGVAGLEYGNECYCGTLDDVEDAELSGECYMPCAGNAEQTCGGPNAINWYYDADLVPPTVELPAGWSTYGVVTEGTQGQRLLSTMLYASNDNTVEKCAQSCATAGYKVAGTEYSAECFCGNGFTALAGGGERVDDSAAFMACSGNLAQKCGGPSILSITSAFGDSIPLV